MCDSGCNNIDESTAEGQYVDFLKKKPEIRTSQLYETLNLPERFECPYIFTGYGIQKGKRNPFYITVNSEYGYYTPNPHTVPTRYFPRSQQFSTALAQCGMYRNYSLNTHMDKSFY